MKYRVTYTKKYLKDLESFKKRKEFNAEELKIVLKKLMEGEKLDKKYKDHRLQNSRNYKNVRECHITPDWLLVYKIDKQQLVLLLMRTGTHSDLF